MARKRNDRLEKPAGFSLINFPDCCLTCEHASITFPTDFQQLICVVEIPIISMGPLVEDNGWCPKFTRSEEWPIF